jgi:enediyne biosynthesis protein E7
MGVMSARIAVSGPSAARAPAVIATLVRSPLDGYRGLAAAYGDSVRVPIGPRSAFFLLSRPEHAEHVLAAAQDNYVKAVTYRPLRALLGDGLLTSEGDRWRRHRRLVQPMFSRRDVRAFGPAITAATRRLLERWDELPDGCHVDVAASMSGLALAVVGSALFGADLGGETDAVGRAIDAGQRLATVASFLPVPWGPRSSAALKLAVRRVSRTPDGIDGPVDRVIAVRRAKLRTAVPPDRHRDLLDVLLTARAEDGTTLTDAEVRAEVSTFLVAGHETSANTLSWALTLLSAFPAARARLEDEVDSVLAGREPQPADLDRLPWTAAVISEALRLYPPAWTIERNALADDSVAGIAVPAGSLVAVPPYLVHRHGEFWPDPAGFDPGRFRPAGDAPAAARPRYAYIPFGGGRRACVGQAFAELETGLVLAAVAQRYRLELTGAGLPKPTANVTLRPGRGLPMRLTRRF